MGILYLHSCLSQFLTINLILSVSPQAFPIAQVVKNLPEVQETRVRPLGRKGPLEKGMATLSSILAWRMPWTEEPRWLQSMGSQKVRQN